MNQLFDGITVVTGTNNIVFSAIVFDDTVGPWASWYETVAFAIRHVELETDEPVAFLKQIFIQSMSDRGLTIITNTGEEN
jgi:hypothetical protein